jgi:lipopolysaccharide export LptBFGC system permease protein LptF
MESGKFSGIKIWQFVPRGLAADRNPPTHITAESGEMEFDGMSQTFLLKLHNGNAEYFGDEALAPGEKSPQIISFGDVTINLPAGELIKSANGTEKKLHRMVLGELLAAKKSLDEKKSEFSNGEIGRRKTLINMQISTHIAYAAGILIMTLLAIPLAIKTNRADTSLNVAIALSLCLAYYFAMVIFSLLGAHTRLRPDILVWTPNVALLALGLFSFNRASQH